MKLGSHKLILTETRDGFERIRLSMRLWRDPRVPLWTKATLPAVAAMYLILPIDLIPDFFLGLGQIDDLSVIGIMLFAMTRVLPKLAPQQLVQEHLDELRRKERKAGARGDYFDADYTVVDER
jgi:uncharacterized membrane protein YkvA (DUF1232 family)